MGSTGFAYAARLAGTPGTFGVEYAEQVPGTGRDSNHYHTVWHGTFRSADGRVADTDATLEDEADRHEGDALVPVTRTAWGTYYTARPNYALGWLCMCFGGGCLTACALPPLRFGRPFRRTDPQAPAWVRKVLRIAWGCLITCGAAGAAALAAAVVA
ncbi:hypothetical protein ACH4UM_16740 [Streptomyces sp. NPDC020801]|uniref:hypothetical protein n=1 Tax=unclassified Streptomyces TaxID=2593676 RepID=UPI0037A1AD98